MNKTEVKMPGRMQGVIDAPEYSGLEWTRADEFTLKHAEDLRGAPDLYTAHDIIVGGRKGKKADKHVAAILTMCEIRGVAICGHPIVRVSDTSVRIGALP